MAYCIGWLWWNTVQTDSWTLDSGREDSGDNTKPLSYESTLLCKVTFWSALASWSNKSWNYRFPWCETQRPNCRCGKIKDVVSDLDQQQKTACNSDSDDRSPSLCSTLLLYLISSRIGFTACRSLGYKRFTHSICHPKLPERTKERMRSHLTASAGPWPLRVPPADRRVRSSVQTLWPKDLDQTRSTP